MLVKNFILGIGVTNEKEEIILEYIVKNIEQNTKKYYITTPNPEIIVYATKHEAFKKILNEADVALCDGAGLAWAGKILQKSFIERVTGVDLMEHLCKKVAKKPITVGFLGGRGRVAEQTANRLKERYPDLKIVLAEAGNPDKKTVELIQKKAGQHSDTMGLKKTTDYRLPTTAKSDLATTKETVDSRPWTVDILFVAFGFPKQEEWIADNLAEMPVRYAITVGGAFDYISGSVPRAPAILRKLGIEWLFRLVIQPWRVKRQLSLLEFVLLVFKEHKFF